MNIFVLDLDPKLAAQAHYDKHVVKMALESAQILSTAINLNGGKGPYKSTHTKHPCVIWAAKTRQNYDWLWKLHNYLCLEYTHRFGKQHATYRLLPSTVPFIPTIINNHGFALAMPPECMISKDPVECYRYYYNTLKKHLKKYTKREAPIWIQA
jgi:hypothetical protein